MEKAVVTSKARTRHFPNIVACRLCKNSRLIILIKHDANIHAVMLADDLENVLTKNEVRTASFIQACSFR